MAKENQSAKGATGPKTSMDSEGILDQIPVKGGRKCQSWIESFVEQTDNLDAPLIYRRWTAISLIAAALEQTGVSRTAH